MNQKHSLQLKDVLLKTELFLKKSNGSVWAANSVKNILSIIAKELNNIKLQNPINQHKLTLLFAPTSSLQEISIENSWAEDFLKLADHFEKLTSC